MKEKFSPVRLCINILITLAAAAVYFYVVLPPINIRSTEFWSFVILALLFFCVLTLITAKAGIRPDTKPKEAVQVIWKTCKIPLAIALACVLFCIIGTVISSVIFNSGAYSSLIDIKESDFSKDVTEISFDQIPMLDESSANALANRKLGELRDLVSQFEVDASSAQINYRNAPVRVTYLNYGDFFKWFKNRGEGIPAYIVTDMVTQEVSVIRTESGIKYSPSEWFNRNITRHLRFHYPTKMFTDINFEIDDDGTPYWIASVLTKRIGIFGGRDISGAVLVNAITGECTYYDVADIPIWVDRVYSAGLIIEQYDYRGVYQNGFWNSIFGQTGCTKSTQGYNYIAQDDDVWVYTGITSVGGDESNIGFILVNQRTKEARFYNVAGAEEFSAMSSAQGSVQQYKYTATFPLLLNIEGQPTYFMALKDASSLVKMYAMVNVQQYQIVSNGYSLSECLENYLTQLKKNNLAGGEEPPAQITEAEITGTVAEIRQAVLNGTTNFYIRLAEAPEACYRLSADESENAVILNIGDTVTLIYDEANAENTIIYARLK